MQNQPNDHVDLWAREHYKSTIITFGLTIQEILQSHGEGGTGEELTFGFFSYNRPTAVKFLGHIKQEAEHNWCLKLLFPDILWAEPQKEASKWSIYTGIQFRRKRISKEATVEGYGLIDGLPVGPHFDRLVYDDVVTKDVVRTSDMIQKVTENLELSYNLGARGGERRMIGTRYHYNDSYKVVMDRKTFIPRIHAATDDATVAGKPVLLSPDELKQKRKDQGIYTFSCQMLLNPKADSKQGFLGDWLRYYDNLNPENLNLYYVTDPAGSKSLDADYTSGWVLGFGEDLNIYAVDFFRDRLNLTERTKKLMDLHRKYRKVGKGILGVGYEKYGKDSDIEHIQSVQERETYRFEITELHGPLGNEERVKRLVPYFEQGRIWLPRQLHYTDTEGTVLDMVQVFINEEYHPFPVGMHADMLDSLSRVLDDDLGAEYPLGDDWGGKLEYDNRGIR